MALSVTRELRLRLDERYGVLRLGVTGPLQAEVGYIVNVKTIDTIVEEILHARQSNGPLPAGAVVLHLWQSLPSRLPALTSLCAVELSLSPGVRYSMSHRTDTMLYLTCQFDFSAAHRLHVPSLSDDENRREFGKCVGLHGHNYVLEVTVAGLPGPLSGEVYPVPRLQEKVKQLVVNRFDHTCLNSDVDEFACLNPTVENLATVVWNLLEGQFEPAVLERVRIYETPKIWADRGRSL
jgi:6-pyruvoyltetrahydropterin/6-carboxytetrahydropterin synthase